MTRSLFQYLKNLFITLFKIIYRKIFQLKMLNINKISNYIIYKNSFIKSKKLINYIYISYIKIFQIFYIYLKLSSL